MREAKGFMKFFPNMFAKVILAVALGLFAAAMPTAAQSSKIPDWQTAASGGIKFEVASVKQNTSDTKAQRSNVDWSDQPSFTPTGSLFSTTNLRLIQYISFAYELTIEEYIAVQPQLPKWVNTDRFDIEARAVGNPTKDQYRLMMQALLAD